LLNFTTFFDYNYLTKGVLLYNSLLNVIKTPFNLYILCLDEKTYNFFNLNKDDFKYIQLLKIVDFELENQELQFAKQNRTLVEYYFTLSPILPLYLLKKFKLDHICSMDADLFFYNSPEKYFDYLNQYSIIITPHKFSKELSDREKYGLFNVSFQIFKNDEIGIGCLTKWKNQCIEWCKDQYDEINMRFADQKYLDNWKDDFKNSLFILEGSDTGLAIWNINNYKLKFYKNNLYSNNTKVIFFHFHNFKSITTNIVLNGFYHYKVKSNDTLNIIYNQYWNNIRNTTLKYDLIIDSSIRLKQTSLLTKLLNECTFYYFNNNKTRLINLKYIPKILRKIFIKIYG